MTFVSRTDTLGFPLSLGTPVTTPGKLRAARRSRRRVVASDPAARANLRRTAVFARDLVALTGLFGTLYGWTWFAAALGAS